MSTSSMREKNWAGNLTYQSKAVHRPASLAELQEIVAASPNLTALGTRHSFNGLADTDAEHVSLERLNSVVSIDPATPSVTIEGGARYGVLGAFLHEKGFALHNLASLPHISVAGACATASHGSGNRCGNLATTVRALEIVAADGSVVKISRQENPDTFPGAVVALGALGIVSKLTLDIEPTFEVRQDLYENLPLEELESNFDAITASAYSVSLFTDWQRDEFRQIWQKRRVTASDALALEPTFFGATLATENQHPLPGHPAECCTPQLGLPGPWHERLQHFRLDFTPSSGAELQSEYYVPREIAYPALKSLFALREKIAPHVFVTEIRTVAADDLWLSPCYRRDRVALHFTWKPDWPNVKTLLPQIEAALTPFDPIPHWGKLYTMNDKQIRSLYPRFNDFKELAHCFDPRGKFKNAHLSKLLDTSSTTP